MDMNSMWLQQSVEIPDPFSITGPSFLGTTTAVNPSTTTKIVSGEELSLTKLDLDFTRGRMMRMSEQRPSNRLASMANQSGADYDDIKKRLSQLNREKEKWRTTEMELDHVKRQLSTAKDEAAHVKELNISEKRTLDMWKKRADDEVALRIDAERNLQQAELAHDSTVQSLTIEMAKIKRDGSRALTDCSSQLRFEMSEKVSALEEANTTLRQELCRRDELHMSLEEEVDALSRKVAISTADLADAQLELDHVQEVHNKQVMMLSLEHTQLSNEYVQRLSTLEEEHKNVAKEAKSRQSMSDETRMRMNKLAGEHTATLELLSERDEQVRSLHRQLEETRVAMNRSKEEAVSVVTRTLCETNDRHAKIAKDLKDDVTSALDQSSKLRLQLSEALGKVDAASVQLRALSEETCNAHKNGSVLSERLALLEVEMQGAAEDLDAASQRCLDAEKDRDEVVEELSAELAALRQQMAQVQSDAHVEKSHWSHEKRSLMVQESAGRQQIAEMTRQLDESRDDTKKQVQRGQADVNQQLQRLQAEKDGVVHSYDLLHNRYTEVVNRCQSLSSEVESLRNRITMLEKRSSPCRKVQRDSGAFHGTRQPLALLQNNRRGSQSPPRKKLVTQQGYQKIFAITGFEDKELLTSIVGSFDDVKVIDLKANATVPASLTHLITNGNLTVKLLSALVQGSWVLPEKYIGESIAAKQWLPERDFGFRHPVPPLKNKKIFFTDDFEATRNFKTAELVARDGGALLVDGVDEADMVVCHGAELSRFPNCGFTWEMLANAIYPEKIK